MTIIAKDDSEIIQFNIKTMFLHGNIAEILHMEQLERFIYFVKINTTYKSIYKNDSF